MMRRSAVVATLTMGVATVAFPCGGSNSYDVDGPLLSAASFAERALAPIRDLESMTRDEIRVLPGLMRADSTRFAGLIGRQVFLDHWWDTTVKVRVPEPDGAALAAAWRAGDVPRAVREAQQVAARILALPAEDLGARDTLLRRAAETVDLAPAVSALPVAQRAAAFERLAAPYRGMSVDSLAKQASLPGDAPRRATMQFAALRVAMRDGIPDGARDEIAKAVPPARWDSLHAAHRAWLAAHAGHPYAGLVQFSRLRLFFLASQADSAWATAVQLYRTWPVRAGAEMRYMLLAGLAAPVTMLADERVPMEVRAALVGNLRPPRATWDALMRAAEANRGAPWSENLQERLLAMLASDTTARITLPATMPAWRAGASPFWRHMWAAAMLRAGRADDAVAFTRTPVTPAQDSLLAPESAFLAARIHMARGDWTSAASTPLLDAWTRRYIIRVLAPESAVPAIARVSVAEVSREATVVLAVRAAQQGRWGEAAALVQPFDAPRAARYLRLGTLSRDTASNAGLLRFATALSSMGGTVFYEQSRYAYRGMMNRDWALYPRFAEDSAAVWDLPWTRQHERSRMMVSLREGSERLLALKAFRSYFGRAGVTAAERRAAVRVADRTYRALLDTDPSRSDSGFWVDSLPGSPEARAIRAAGRGETVR